MTRAAPTAVVLTALAAALLGPAQQAFAGDAQPLPVTAQSRVAARQAAASPATLATLSRFFAREGRVSIEAARPRIEGTTVAVHYLSPDFVAGKAGAPVARLEFLASKAVSADGQLATLWTVATGGRWEVVNIATGDEEFRYAARGAAKLPGGTVFREPQTDSWFVVRDTRVLPLDQDAVRAVGADGTTLAAYRARVTEAYGDRRPGSPYARSGRAGGPPPAVASADAAFEDPGYDLPAAAGAAAGALALGVLLALLGRRVRRGRMKP
ncbi:hypothetical protein [Streptomyces sp. NPDC006879]|uniref:hypothetical protein n=1 Tax=Streptomyces sp. NPDC006879 TaxID=3364767 RepID=UPI0036BF843C